MPHEKERGKERPKMSFLGAIIHRHNFSVLTSLDAFKGIVWVILSGVVRGTYQ